MDTRLVYGQVPKFTGVEDATSYAGFDWCGMLRSEDENGESLAALTDYQFEVAALDVNILDDAKKLNLLFIWQKLQLKSLEFKRLLFVDYTTEVQRIDYPGLGSNNGVYYEVGEVLPYIAVEVRTNKQIFFNDGMARDLEIQDVKLQITDQKYDTEEYKNLFSRVILPYREWMQDETKQYHNSLFHESYGHELFASFTEWQSQVDARTIAPSQYKLFIKRQTERIIDELKRTVSQPKDERTIKGFISQIGMVENKLQVLRDKIKTDRKPNNESEAVMLEISDYDTWYTEIDEIIFDLDVTESAENKLVLQELFAYVLSISKNTSLSQIEWLPFTSKQCLVICKMCIYYFKSLLEEKLDDQNESIILSSQEIKLIEFSAQAYVLCMALLLSVKLELER